MAKNAEQDQAAPSPPGPVRPAGWTRPLTSHGPSHLLLTDGSVACGAEGFNVTGHTPKPKRALPCKRCNRSRLLDGRFPGFASIPAGEQSMAARYR